VDFHEKHFSLELRDHFSTHFLGPVEQDTEAENFEEDDLGYYPDGIKRTLTDEQIAIFRHSEIETLLREQRHAQELQSNSDSPTASIDPVAPEVEEGELEDTPSSVVSKKSKAVTINSTSDTKKKAGKMNTKQRKAQYAKEKGFFKQKIKPDLRKRTWDKVDAGMDSLMYDEDGSGGSTAGTAAQRRRISYDDD